STQQRESSRPAAEEPASASSPADQSLTRSQASRPVIQDFVPLAKTLEWQLGQQYLKDRGSAAFTTDSSPVPVLVNNDGTPSPHAAEVFYERLEMRGEGRETED